MAESIARVVHIRYNAAMIAAIVLRCDWSGCKATVTIDRVAVAAITDKGWRADRDGLYRSQGSANTGTKDSRT